MNTMNHIVDCGYHWHYSVETHRGTSILVQALESHMIEMDGEYSVVSEMDYSVSPKLSHATQA